MLSGPLFLLALALAPNSPAADKEQPVYELRIYYAAPGKLDALNARFRDHTMKLFSRHGITNVAYWVPLDNKDNKLIYLLSFPNQQARQKAWKEFLADPDWQKTFKESEKEGKLVERIESRLLTPTDYSPPVKASGAGGHVVEMRTYTASSDNLPALNARFRDHTLKLFEKHGIQNLWYFNVLKGQKGADDTLIYFLAHKSADAAKESFTAFRADPEWVKARAESEKKAGGPLTVKDGVKSEFLKATDYSPLR
jgi:hypothetical protein